MSFILCETITQTFLERVARSPKQVAFQFKPGNRWRMVTFSQFHEECERVSMGLASLGVTQGDHVAILSSTRYEWSLCDMAILGVRALTIPIYPSNTAEDIAYILNHSEAKVLILENAHQLGKISAPLPKLEKIIMIDPRGAEPTAEGLLMSLTTLSELGTSRCESHPHDFTRGLKEARDTDPITICYTSGTTGLPKGVVLTHANLMSVLEDCVSLVKGVIQPDQEVILSFLPTSHILGKVESMTLYTFGWRQAFAENLDKVMTNLSEVKPTLLFAVPRIFEKAQARILEAVEGNSIAKRKLFQWGLKVGREYFTAIWKKHPPSVGSFGQYLVAKNFVFKSVLDRFGGRLKLAVCGGAPLSAEIGEFFQILGIEILEGYGLTETCAPVSFNIPGHARFGTVGVPLPEVSLKIAEDGEILIKSKKVFREYYRELEETRKVMEGDWFHTGDIGFIDDDGYLHIIDRKKDLIITSAGKNIAPQKIENLAKAHPIITQCVIYGDRKNYLTALITLDREQVIRLASENQILFSEYQGLIKHQKILTLVQRVVDEINRKLPTFETLKKFAVVPDEFTVENGLLTPSLKIKRKMVYQRYGDLLESMYS